MTDSQSPTKTLTNILLVEDNPADIRLTQEAFKEANQNTILHVVRDGAEALEFLRQTGRFTAVPRPDMILLDLNLPKKDGRQVLAEIKKTPDIKRIPIVILTNSKAAEDIRQTYEHHANSYITKPANLDEFMTVIKQIEQFWLSIVQLP
ncbi:MAG: response regulator [Chloroflexi bacterium]|nr:response regulator [Chloroflexota bacterium]MBK6712480.1 response regulator [Chloroflexota bacterium]MBK7178328.1 response regulator [Chloroflexota bacterium]MBK7916438.1 response regulator [Chloroflexota bacterium]MBK8933818.1 response regulator [Chloroflexota bacterium]